MRWLVLVCVGCGSVEGKMTDAAVSADAAADAAMGLDSAGPACDVTKPFGDPVVVTGVSGTGQERYGFLSGDQLVIYFSDVAADRQIYSATRSSPTSTFANPTLLAGVNTTSNEEHPAVTADGLILVADTSAFGNTVDIGIATRANAALNFGALSQLAVVNTNTAHELDAFISADGLKLLFGSDRTGSEFRIYQATRTSVNSAFGTPVEISELNSPSAVDSGPVLSADGLEIFFSSNRTGAGATDIWRATRSSPTATFDTPTIVSELSTSYIELTSWLSPDRCRIIFTSDRLGTYDLWMATRPQ